MLNLTAKDTLKELEPYPDDMPIMIRGHEGAWNNLTNIVKDKLIIDYYSGLVMGHHVSLEEINLNETGGAISDKKHLIEKEAICLSHTKGAPTITIKTFRESLKSMEADIQIMVEGFSGGWNYLGELKTHTLMLNYFEGESIGDHADIREHPEEYDPSQFVFVKALCLYDHGSLP